jgi:RimJ/RimL family protein N-acetyltransferase
MVNIRLLGEADGEAFIRLRLEGLQNDPIAFGSSWEEERTHTPESIAPRLRAMPDGNFVVGAFKDDRLIGLSGLVRTERRKTRHIGSVWGVYVTPDERGSGIARALLMFLLERARGYDGLDQITLSVAAPQEAARQLYASLGFEAYGYEQHALKVEDRYVDEAHMVMWITPPTAPIRWPLK